MNKEEMYCDWLMHQQNHKNIFGFWALSSPFSIVGKAAGMSKLCKLDKCTIYSGAVMRCI
jgi:hypothetical protein